MIPARVMRVPVAARPVTEEQVRRLHEQLEFARRNFRPAQGFLLDAPQQRLPGKGRR